MRNLFKFRTSGSIRNENHDASKAVISKIARKKAKENGVDIDFYKGDMRNISVPGRFDAAIIMFSSFLYMKTTEDMIKALKSVNHKLKKGGILIIDVAALWNFLATGRAKRKIHEIYQVTSQTIIT